jgi:lipopolysaccharide transport system ATP-binding protein
MSNVAITTNGLGKRYTLGLHRRGYDTLRDSIVDAARRPFQRIGRGRSQPSADTLWALRDLNLTIRDGEVVGLIGHNGAGKTTLLKILARITEPTAGWAEVTGRVGSLLEVGTGFHPELTGRENIFLNGAILGMRRAEIRRRFDEIVEFAEIERFLDTPVKRYSSGMSVRLAFAVAAHLEPQILLVDEVLAVGDAAFQRKSLGKMGEVAE